MKNTDTLNEVNTIWIWRKKIEWQNTRQKKNGKFQKYQKNETYWQLIKKGGPVGLTIKEAVKEKKLQPGDILAFKDRTHTVVYSGDGTYVYEGGSIPKKLGYKKVGIKVDYAKTHYKDKKISQIIRWKN